jgi:hypothetical protein
MTILFVCGSIENGKDGVGDYTRRLACELIRQGHTCSIIGLMDKFISSQLLELQECDNQTVEVFRLPFSSGYKLNCSIARERIQKLKPEWTSLQFVLFAFDNKGLPFDLAYSFKKIIFDGTKLHIMFHELWVGMDTDASSKERLWGGVQKLIIFNIIRKLKPLVIHTHVELYRYKIAKNDYIVKILPLFGSIPFFTFNSKSYVSKNEIVVFGGIHKGALIEDFVKILQENKDLFHQPIKIVFIGRNGSELENWKNICSRYCIDTDVLGEQPVDIISQKLQNSIAGISTTPLILAEKSSAVAALLDYNLTVLDLGRDWKPRAINDIKPLKEIVDYKSFLDRYYSLKNAPVKQYRNSLYNCAALFVNDLNSIST